MSTVRHGAAHGLTRCGRSPSSCGLTNWRAAQSLPALLHDRLRDGKFTVMNTRTIAIAALVIAVILVLILVL
jgi:hypothetical protein